MTAYGVEVDEAAQLALETLPPGLLRGYATNRPVGQRNSIFQKSDSRMDVSIVA